MTVARVTIALLALLVFATPATAATNPDQKTVTSNVLFYHGEDPADPGHCAAAVFAPWKAEKGWVAQNISWKVQLSSGAQRDESVAAVPPAFEDVYKFGAIVWTVPAGMHWQSIALTYADGPSRNDCGEFDAKHRTFVVGNVATVTLGITPACETATDAYAAAKRATKRAEKALKGTTGKKRTAAKRKLASAKTKQRKAKAKRLSNC